ncbi:hypothetical protein CCP2SC5_730012 [Azospirillaceae bacterium]
MALPPSDGATANVAAMAMNKRVAQLLTRFGQDGNRVLSEAAAFPNDIASLLRHPTLVNENGLIKLHTIGAMDALISMAIGAPPAMAPPKNLPAIVNALTLFVQINFTPQLCWREKDTPEAWSTRIIDVLFSGLAQKKVFNHADFIALDHISQNPMWQGLFNYALGLFLAAIADPKRVATLDRTTAGGALQAFKAAAVARQARLPKVKYGNPMAGFKDIAEYAIGEYLDGLNVNEALSRTLVQSQLGTGSADGKEKFQSFLKDNQIQPETFPTTVNVLYENIQRLCRFQESEGEVAAVCYSYAQEKKESGKIEKIFGNFADPIFPVAAKCRRHFAFDNIEPNDAIQIMGGGGGAPVFGPNVGGGGFWAWGVFFLGGERPMF